MSRQPHATLAGNPVHMIRPHLRDVPDIGLPEGYAIRPLRVEEGTVWNDVVLDADRLAWTLAGEGEWTKRRGPAAIDTHARLQQLARGRANG